MISVTRLNGKRFVLNAELIRTIEENPDTVITLITGDHLVVAEGTEEIVRRVIEYGRYLRRAVPVEFPLFEDPPPARRTGPDAHAG